MLVFLSQPRILALLRSWDWWEKVKESEIFGRPVLA